MPFHRDNAHKHVLHSLLCGLKVHMWSLFWMMLIKGESRSSGKQFHLIPWNPPHHHHTTQARREEERQSRRLLYGVTEGYLLGQCGLGYYQALTCVSGARFNQLFFSDWEMIGQDGTES